VRESVAELKKVEWPNRPQVFTGTLVVIIACAIVGAYLWVADQVFRAIVEKVLL
jgi:preprotein translocase subunit SecE